MPISSQLDMLGTTVSLYPGETVFHAYEVWSHRKKYHGFTRLDCVLTITDFRVYLGTKRGLFFSRVNSEVNVANLGSTNMTHRVRFSLLQLVADALIIRLICNLPSAITASIVGGSSSWLVAAAAWAGIAAAAVCGICLACRGAASRGRNAAVYILLGILNFFCPIIRTTPFTIHILGEPRPLRFAVVHKFGVPNATGDIFHALGGITRGIS
jgi:hypothetical protein